MSEFIDLSDFENVKKYFPNTYIYIVKHLTKPLSKKQTSDSIRQFVEDEGLFELFYYLKENLKPGNKMRHLLKSFENRIVKHTLDLNKSYYTFSNGYLYEDTVLDSQFATNMYIENFIFKTIF